MKRALEFRNYKQPSSMARITYALQRGYSTGYNPIVTAMRQSIDGLSREVNELRMQIEPVPQLSEQLTDLSKEVIIVDNAHTRGRDGVNKELLSLRKLIWKSEDKASIHVALLVGLAGLSVIIGYLGHRKMSGLEDRIEAVCADQDNKISISKT